MGPSLPSEAIPRSGSLQSGFARSLRVRKTREYDFIKQEGARAYGQLLMISYGRRRPTNNVSVTDTSVADARLGIAVTKKVAPRAVDRNRFKRTIREAFRLCRAQILKPVDIVVVARREINSVSREKLTAEFLALLRQEKLTAS